MSTSCNFSEIGEKRLRRDANRALDQLLLVTQDLSLEEKIRRLSEAMKSNEPNFNAGIACYALALERLQG